MVIGTEFARAVEANRAWRARRSPGHESPIGAGYEVWKGEQDLLRFSASELDSLMGRVVSSYREATMEERIMLRDRFSLNDCYTLLMFARRSAVVAIRRRDASAAVDGLVAVVMVDPERVDRRDILPPVALLFFVLDQLGANVAEVFADVAALSDSEVASSVTAFPHRVGPEFDLSDWGFMAVDTPSGAAFADVSIGPYDPTLGLLDAGLGIASALDDDVYHSSLTVATSLPAVWIGVGPRNPDRALADDTIRAGLTVHGLLSPDVSPQSTNQQMTVFLCEATRPGDATQIAEWATAELGTIDHVGFALADGPVVAVVVARSVVTGVGSYESQSSVLRFRERFAAAVRSVL